MDKMDLIKNGIKVAAQCTAQPNVSSVLKTICKSFVPDMIDFIAEKRALSVIKHEQEAATGDPFDPFEEVEGDGLENTRTQTVMKSEPRVTVK